MQRALQRPNSFGFSLSLVSANPRGRFSEVIDDRAKFDASLVAIGWLRGLSGLSTYLAVRGIGSTGLGPS